MNPRPALFASAALLALAAAGLAAEPAPATGTAVPMPMPSSARASSAAGDDMMQAMQKMQAATAALSMTGNPDQLFAAMMVPHHQAAVDMARIELRDGHDPRMRALARSVITSQGKEIKEMNAWLANHSQ